MGFRRLEVVHCVHQTELCKGLNEDGLLTHFLFFHRLKYLNCGTGGDKHGGFIRKDKREIIAKKLGVGKSTLCSHLRFFVSIGWAIERSDSYQLIGWRYFRKYSPNLTKITIIEKEKIEYFIQIAKLFLKNNIRQQAFKKAQENKTGKRLYPKNAALLSSEEFTVSTRGLAKALGISSPTTAVKIQKELEKRGEITIIRKSELVCALGDYSRLLSHGKLNKKKCFIDGGLVYQRLCNNITPVKTKEDEDIIRARWFSRANAKLEKAMNPFGKNFDFEFA